MSSDHWIAGEDWAIGQIEQVHVLDGPLAKARGVIGRYPVPSEAFVFPFDDVAERGVHMIGVRRPLCVRWYREQELVAERTLRAWVGRASTEADCVVETSPQAPLPETCPDCGAPE